MRRYLLCFIVLLLLLLKSRIFRFSTLLLSDKRSHVRVRVWVMLSPSFYVRLHFHSSYASYDYFRVLHHPGTTRQLIIWVCGSGGASSRARYYLQVRCAKRGSPINRVQQYYSLLVSTLLPLGHFVHTRSRGRASARLRVAPPVCFKIF